MDITQSLIYLSVILYWPCIGAYTVYWSFSFTRWKIRFYVLLGIILVHVAATTLRGIAIGYFPLTNKFESFSAFAIATFIILLIYSKTESRIYRLTLFGVGYGFFWGLRFFLKV